MADRTIVEYTETRLDDGPFWRLKIDRSSKGAPGGFITLTCDALGGEFHDEMTILVDDLRTVFRPALAWVEANVK